MSYLRSHMVVPDRFLSNPLLLNVATRYALLYYALISAPNGVHMPYLPGRGDVQGRLWDLLWDGWASKNQGRGIVRAASYLDEDMRYPPLPATSEMHARTCFLSSHSVPRKKKHEDAYSRHSLGAFDSASYAQQTDPPHTYTGIYSFRDRTQALMSEINTGRFSAKGDDFNQAWVLLYPGWFVVAGMSALARQVTSAHTHADPPFDLSSLQRKLESLKALSSPSKMSPGHYTDLCWWCVELAHLTNYGLKTLLARTDWESKTDKSTVLHRWELLWNVLAMATLQTYGGVDTLRTDLGQKNPWLFREVWRVTHGYSALVEDYCQEQIHRMLYERGHRQEELSWPLPELRLAEIPRSISMHAVCNALHAEGVFTDLQRDFLRAIYTPRWADRKTVKPLFWGVEHFLDPHALEKAAQSWDAEVTQSNRTGPIDTWSPV